MIARRTQEIEPFLAVEVFQRAQALERQGIDVIHLEFGEPDFDTPAVIREAAEKALKDGRTRYAHSLGLVPLREAIAEHYRARYGVTVNCIAPGFIESDMTASIDEATRKKLYARIPMGKPGTPREVARSCRAARA